MDFTITIYKQLLKALISSGYNFITFDQYCKRNIPDKAIVLRHDVDLLPQNSMLFAKIQSELGIVGSYFFRAVPESWNEHIIKDISNLGHEVGYHYENMDTCNGDIDNAWKDFNHNLGLLRELVAVSTICMHGSPRSKFDNKDLWSKYDYKSLNLIGEPYFDVNFETMFYLTDTGRRWDGWKVSVRYKVPQQEEWNRKDLVFHSTKDIIYGLTKENFPDKIMFTMHPQRWHDSNKLWLRELLVQSVKNVIKKYFFVK